MRAGRLRHRVAVERFTSVQDPDTGIITETWAALFSGVPASVEPLTGREYIAAQQAQSEVTTRIRMRYHAGILSADRITHAGTAYNVISVINKDMRNLELELMCKSAG